MKSILEHRTKSIALTKDLEEALQLIDKLTDAIATKHRNFDRECGHIENAATGYQMAKYVLWVAKNQAVIKRKMPSALPGRPLSGVR